MSYSHTINITGYEPAKLEPPQNWVVTSFKEFGNSAANDRLSKEAGDVVLTVEGAKGDETFSRRVYFIKAGFG